MSDLKKTYDHGQYGESHPCIRIKARRRGKLVEIGILLKELSFHRQQVPAALAAPDKLICVIDRISILVRK